MDSSSAPIIVTATLGDADFAWADGLRRAHYPPERNRVPAHLTLFRHLMPSLADELHDRLKAATRGVPAPVAAVAAVSNLGQGVALRIWCEGLEAIRADLADAFTGLLTPQDSAGWRPHITVQSKVPAAQARALYTALSAEIARPRPVRISGLASWRYLGGSWQAIRGYRFG